MVNKPLKGFEPSTCASLQTFCEAKAVIFGQAFFAQAKKVVRERRSITQPASDCWQLPG